MASSGPCGRSGIGSGGVRAPLVMRKTPFSSSVATKALIAVSGLALFAFLVIHLAGNLLVFAGPEVFNSYSRALWSTPLPWVVDFSLLAIVLVHIWKTVTNYIANRRARPQGYVRKEWAGKPSRKSVASTTMIASGTLIVAFVVVHLKHFRFANAHEHPGGLYGLEMATFSNPWAVLFYVVSMVVIGFHLWHGLWSSMNSLGIVNARYAPGVLRVGKVLAALIAGGFLLIPIWAYFFGSRP